MKADIFKEGARCVVSCVLTVSIVLTVVFTIFNGRDFEGKHGHSQIPTANEDTISGHGLNAKKSKVKCSFDFDSKNPF